MHWFRLFIVAFVTLCTINQTWGMKSDMQVAVSICGSDFRAPMLGKRLVESILRFGLPDPSDQLHIHFVVDGDVASLKVLEFAQQRVNKLQFKHRVFLHWHSLANDKHIMGMPHMFKYCSVNRLVLPDALPGIDRVLYLDLDSIVLQNLRDFYALFDRFAPQQAVGAALEHERGVGGGYVERHIEQAGQCSKYAPFCGLTGVNAGVLMLDLDKLRASGFVEAMKTVANQQPKPAFVPTPERPCPSTFEGFAFLHPMGDQCLLNYYLNATPSALYVFPPTWNWRFADSDTAVWSQPPHRPALFHAHRLFWMGGEHRWWVPEEEKPWAAWLDQMFVRLDKLSQDDYTLEQKVQAERQRRTEGPGQEGKLVENSNTQRIEL